MSPDYFKTLNMPLVSGRDFTEQDTATAPGAIIINEAMARSVWDTTDVLGRQFEAQVLGDTKTTLTVVGVAPDAQVDTLGAEGRSVRLRAGRAAIHGPRIAAREVHQAAA